MFRPSNRISAPEEVGVDLVGLLEVLKLLQAREGAELVDVVRHLDALEDLVELPRAVARRELAGEARQLTVDAVEVDAIAAIVGARRSHGDLAAGKFVGDDLRDLPDAVVV